MKYLYKVLLVALMAINFACANNNDDDDNATVVAPAPTFPEIVNGTLTFQNQERVFTLHIPSSYNGSTATPLVLFLHGGGGNSQSAQNFTNFNTISDQEGFLVAYPQGGFTAGPNSFVWADGRGLGADTQGIDDVGFINALVDQLIQDYNVNPAKVYLCGFSNGSFLTQKIAFENNTRFAAMGTLGGTMHQGFFDTGNPGRAIPMMYVFGTADPLVPYNGGFVSNNPDFERVVGVEQAVDFWVANNQSQTVVPPVEVANFNNADSSTVTVFEYTNGLCNNAAVKFYRINGGGHTWPGVAIQSQDLGRTNLDIQASRELWQFFNLFELCL